MPELINSLSTALSSSNLSSYKAEEVLRILLEDKFDMEGKPVLPQKNEPASVKNSGVAKEDIKKPIKPGETVKF